MKTCTKCEVEKPFAEFSRYKRSKDGHKYACKTCLNKEYKEYSARHPEKSATRQRRYRAKHPERVKTAVAEWRSKPENKEREKETTRKWREARPGYMAKIRSEWSRNNKARKAELARQYTARKLNAFVAEVDEDEIILRDRGQCGICNEPVMGSLSIDHIIPLQPEDPTVTPGTHEPNNVQLAHPACNSRKRNRT